MKRQTGFPKAIATIVGVSFLLFGLWALGAPRSFFDQLAEFHPYNQHFIQDIGAFQIGLGAVLLLAVSARFDTLATALLGVGIGSLAHVVSHFVGSDLGGNTARDIPTFAILSGLILVAGWMQAKKPNA
jgi:hypothetical protein